MSCVIFCGQQALIVRISSFVYNITNYYSVTDNIFQLIVDFWHILLVNDDDDVGFSVFFCTTLLCFAFFFVYPFFPLCMWGCVHDKLAQYAIHIVTTGVQLDELFSFSGSLPCVLYVLYATRAILTVVRNSSFWQITYDWLIGWLLPTNLTQDSVQCLVVAVAGSFQAVITTHMNTQRHMTLIINKRSFTSCWGSCMVDSSSPAFQRYLQSWSE